MLVVLKQEGEEIIALRTGELLLLPDDIAAHTDGVESISRGADENIPIPVLIDALHTRQPAVGEAVSHKAVGGMVVPTESPGASHPQAVLAVLKKTSHIVVDKRSGVVLVEKVLRETITVETVEAILGGHPDIAAMVLQDVTDRRARQLVGREQPTAHRLCSQQEGQRQAENEKTIQKV